ncbi:radical SAM protein [Pantoea brenneri]|uniref:radical SAM protein n=1 Tax=Pantoea brenneri TaxID=472694 RepID=UPI00244A376F|nr:radical SAM protein [Pantoea brenneri]MDH1089275.1 radical SAM protein [Pantoea brenneri]
MKDIVNTEMFYFTGEDKFIYIYFPIRGYAVKTSMKNNFLVEKLSQRFFLNKNEYRHPLITELREKGLLGEKLKSSPDIQDLEEFRPIEATLLLTESCNLSCSYCYANASTSKYPPMTREIAKASIDLVIENAKNHKNKTAEFRFLGGGEPTLEWVLIEWATHYIRFQADLNGIRCWIRLITNGKSSHKSVMRAARNLCKYNIPCHFRTTISFNAVARLTEMVEYTHKYTDIKTIRFEPMAEIGRASDNSMSKPAQQEFVNAFIAAYQLGKQYGIFVTCKMMSNISRRSTRFCNIEFSITSEGNVAGCHRYSLKKNAGFDFYHVGAWNGRKFDFDIEKINALRRIDARVFPQCNTCFAKWNCASGCLSARMEKGKISQVGPLCHLTKELLKFSIIEALNA